MQQICDLNPQVNAWPVLGKEDELWTCSRGGTEANVPRPPVLCFRCARRFNGFLSGPVFHPITTCCADLSQCLHKVETQPCWLCENCKKVWDKSARWVGLRKRSEHRSRVVVVLFFFFSVPCVDVRLACASSYHPTSVWECDWGRAAAAAARPCASRSVGVCLAVAPVPRRQLGCRPEACH